MTTRYLTVENIISRLAQAGVTAKVSGPADGRIAEVVTDSRMLPRSEGAMFAALRTEVNDGHRYVGEMYGKGVRVFMTERDLGGEYPGSTFIVVGDVRRALALLAGSLARESEGKRILITGSYGKSAVKEVLYRTLLQAGQNVWRSPRSYNSFIGVMLSVFECWFSGAHETEIFEVGIDGPGQAEALMASGMLRPQIGILTPMSDEHDANFPSHRDKIREKIALLEDCAMIIFDNSDKAVGRELEAAFGTAKELIGIDAVGVADFSRMVAGLFVDLAEAADVAIPEMRMSINHGVDGCVLMTDGFTPDLRSLRHALDRQSRHAAPGRRRALILGRLLPDYGSDGERTYADALALARHHGIDTVVAPDLCGELPALKDCHILIFGEMTPATEAYLDSLASVVHDTCLEVDLDALVHNFNYYRHLVPPQTGMVAMVKASAYGMGDIEVGKTLNSHNAAYLAVAVVDEGVAMRQAGITTPILVLNPVTNRYGALFANSLEPAVFSVAELERLSAEAAKAGVESYPVHIKLDTGMHRVGFTEEQLDSLTEALRRHPNIRVRSVFTHLATADCLDMDEYTRSQIDCYYRGCARIEAALGYPFLRHLLNTAGMMRFADAGSYDMARLGIGLYGISPLPGRDPQLKPVATLRSVIISLKRWPAGTPIGYGCKGRTTRESLIATVPIGYADGLDRHLSNGGARFAVNGAQCPVIGNICMDQCMVDVTDAPGVKVGDRVEIFGRQVPVESLAETLGTIPYEILTSVSQRVHRIYYTR